MTKTLPFGHVALYATGFFPGGIARGLKADLQGEIKAVGIAEIMYDLIYLCLKHILGGN